MCLTIVFLSYIFELVTNLVATRHSFLIFCHVKFFIQTWSCSDPGAVEASPDHQSYLFPFGDFAF